MKRKFISIVIVVQHMFISIFIFLVLDTKPLEGQIWITNVEEENEKKTET